MKKEQLVKLYKYFSNNTKSLSSQYEKEINDKDNRLKEYMNKDTVDKRKLDELFVDNKKLYSKLLDITTENTKLDNKIEEEKQIRSKNNENYQTLTFEITKERKLRSEKDNKLQEGKIKLEIQVDN